MLVATRGPASHDPDNRGNVRKCGHSGAAQPAAPRRLNYSQIHGSSVDGVFGFGCEGFEKSQKSGMVRRKKCEIRKNLTLKNATLDAKIGVDRAANEPRNRKNGRPSYRESECRLCVHKRTMLPTAKTNLRLSIDAMIIPFK